ncbi:MAG: YbhB/YbcL family Raf kinase inhibitor-like protein [Candidatus Eremiobacteraeota bacterium]|nr:YbhB/YbcL family Raf kinase inhibitor-like protein [Candidatus Eremiobacteraeota bacterium]
MRLTSSTFAHDGTIPKDCAHVMAGGKNISPGLAWSDAPAGTKSFALLCHDPDAPTGTGFYHWVVFDIPAATTALERGNGDAKSAVPTGAMAGFTDYGEIGYGGPAPPPGPAHHYHFTLYALSKEKLEGLNEHTTGAKLRFMMRDCTLEQATLTGLFASG